MVKQKGLLWLLFTFIIVATIYIVYAVGPISLLWIANIYGAAFALSLVSPISVARKAVYLNAAVPHVTLFSASLATLITGGWVTGTMLLAVAINLLIVFSYQWAVVKGLNEEAVTSIIVGLTTSLSVLTLYFLYRNAGYTGQVSALLIGDPLLVSFGHAAQSAVSAFIIGVITLFTWKKQLIVGIDREYAVSRGVRAKAYDYLFYALLAISSVIYVRTIGYVLLHVLMLMPGAIAMLISSGLSHLLPSSLILSLLASSLSLLIGLYVDLSPVGLIGLFMLFVYVVVNLKRRMEK